MSFETPAALWGLFSLALLAIFSLWRQAASAVTVPSLLLWKRIPERNPPVRALRRPKWRMDLLFQALAITAAVAALAGPVVATSKAKPRKVALVFDTSARLRAGDRLEKLKAEARRLLDGDLRHDDVAFYAAAPAPRRVERLEEVRLLDEHVDPAPLLAVARQEAAYVILFSDRPAEGVPSVLLGGPAGNLGIVEFTAAEDEVFVRIDNHGPAREVPIRLTVGERTREFLETVPAGGRSWHRREDFSKAGAVAVELVVSDPFPLDDRVHAARLSSPRAEVTLAGRHHPALEAAFRSIPGVVLREGAGGALVSVGYDAPPGAARLRVFLRTPEAPRGSAGVRLEDHPLLAGVQAGHLASKGVGELSPEFRGGEPLVTADGKVAGALRGGELHLSVDLDPQFWPKTGSFPIFWTNVVDFARKGSAAFAVVRTGRPFALPGDATGVEPGGRAVGAGGSFLPRAAGPYSLLTPGGSRTFEANLLDERESDVAGTTRPLDWKVGDPSGREPVKKSLGGAAAVLALLFVALAWVLGRRSD